MPEPAATPGVTGQSLLSTELASGFLTLRGRHLLPVLIIVEHALALLGRKFFETRIALGDLLTALGRERLVMQIGLPQFLTALLGKSSPSTQRVQCATTLFGRKLAELIELSLGRGPVFRTHALPLSVIL